MTRPFLSTKVHITNTAERGRCVMSKSALDEGQILERALTIPLPIEEKHLHDTSIIWHYYCITEPFMPDSTLAGHLLLGIGSICNHSAEPNATLTWTEDHCGVWATLQVIKPVCPGEEITIKYTNIADYIDKGLISEPPAAIAVEAIA